jgi:Ca2+-binding RTX toxin-like protein
LSARNVLKGERGADWINGAKGNDVLVGGSGKDAFLFDATLSRTTNVERLTDFRSIDDTLVLDHDVFTKVRGNRWLDSSAFYVGAAAHDSNDRIVYNKATGALFYDPDGSGAAAAIKFAQLNAGTNLRYTDVFVL